MRPTLLLLHGFPLDHTLWTPNVARLAREAEIIAPDLRGFGTNTAQPAMRTMDDLANDLFSLLDQRGIEHVIPCGLSMGGYVAMAMLERSPERLAGLILCNTRSTADTEEAKQGRENTAMEAEQKGMAVIARAMVPKVLGATTRRTKPELSATVETMIARQDARTTAAASRAMALRPDRTEVLRTFAKPALVITGSEDELMPLPTSQAMVAALPSAQLVVIPQAGHLSNLEKPEAFNEAVIAYLERLAE